MNWLVDNGQSINQLVFNPSAKKIVFNFFDFAALGFDAARGVEFVVV